MARRLTVLCALLAACGVPPPPAVSNPAGLHDLSAPPESAVPEPPAEGHVVGVRTPAVAGAEGVARDVDIAFAAGSVLGARTDWAVAVSGPGGWPLPVTVLADPPRLRLLEVPPAWSTLTLRHRGREIAIWSTGADLLADPPRLVAQTPPAGRAVGAGEPIEMRFGRRLDPSAVPAITVDCADGPVAVRWHWARGGARARVEPWPTWGEGPCRLEAAGLSPGDGGPEGAISPDPFEVVAARDRVRLSEVVVDPQRDWSDELGEPYDVSPGSGAVSSADEFVEIVNASGGPVDLRGWRLEMLDGTDEAVVFGDSGAVPIRVEPPWADVAALPPCAVVVVGDPPGLLNNEIVLRLVRPDNSLEDRMHLSGSSAFAGLPGTLARSGGGNAEGPENEAAFPAWTTSAAAPLVQGPATPGLAPCDP